MTIKDQPFFFSLFFDKLADQILLFLVPLVVFQVTGSVSWSGIAFFIETLPRFGASPICGALCDRFSPAKMLRISQTFRALACVLGLAGYYAFGGIGWLIGLSAVCGALSTQSILAREAMLPQAFKNHPFRKTVSYAQIADQVGAVLGPMLAALLIEIAPWEYVVAATAAVFLLADATMAFWRRLSGVVIPDPLAPPGHWLLPYKTALHHVLTLPGLKKLILLTAAVNICLGVTLATSAAMVTGVHGESGAHYALLQAAGAALTVLILFSTAHAPFTLAAMGIIGYVAICLGTALSSFAPSFWIYGIGFLLVIGFDKMFSIYIRTLRQQIIPAQDYGKTTGLVVFLNNLSQPLAGLLVGIFAGPTATGMLILSLAGLMAVVGIAVSIVGVRPVKQAS
ncbi:MFS transporter [Lacibacterium aquatile]|uniref:MFS transporter n=1 Tax=Lacibacterium aquatile TaxID=1168082 RepID=A0ABW5DTE2_9PROT